MKLFCRNRKFFLTLCATVFMAVPLFSEIAFSSLNLNDRDEVLFSLSHKISGSAEYTTVFKGKIKTARRNIFQKL